MSSNKKWYNVMKYLENNPDVLMKVIPDKITLNASKSIRAKIKKNRMRMGMRLPNKEKKSFGIKKFSGNTSILNLKTPNLHYHKKAISHKHIEPISQRASQLRTSSKHQKCPK